MKSLILFITFLLLLSPNAIAQEGPPGFPPGGMPPMARFGIAVIYEGYMDSRIRNSDAPDRNMSNYLGSLQFMYYHNPFFSITTELGFGYRFEYDANSTRRLPTGLAGVAIMDLSTIFSARVPIGMFSSLDFGFGWYFTSALSTLSGYSTSFLRHHDFGFNTGAVFRVGVTAGLALQGNLYFPSGYTLRVDVKNGFSHSVHAGLGYRF